MHIARYLAALVLAGAALAAHAQDAAPAAAPDKVAPAVSARIENSVVKVFSTLRRPDPFKPWTKQAPQSVTGSGVVIEGRRILTNAHVVGYASQVEVQANQSGGKISATVEAIARGMDLAVLKLDDESFFDTHPPVPRASVLPEVRDAVFAYGYPVGGNSLSITKGIVSRIEYVAYAYGTQGLRIQVDAPINPGNSGGAVIDGEKMIGLAFAGVSNAQNIGYIIPNEEIELFLKDVADGHYDGKLLLHEVTQTLENPALRQYLKLDKSLEGVVVSRPYEEDAAYPLKELDVITKIGDYPIDNQGMVRLGSNLRVQYGYYAQRVAKGGRVPLTIVRAGKTMQVQVPLAPPRPLLIHGLDGGYPSYFIWGPMVFSRASAEFMSIVSTNAQAAIAYSANGSPLMTRLGDKPDASREELVVVSAPFFPHKLVSGYSNRVGAVVESINGVPVRSLRHLVSLLRDSKDDLVVIRFAQRVSETMVLPRKAMLEATDAILQDNGIRTQGSADMMEVWNGKSA